MKSFYEFFINKFFEKLLSDSFQIRVYDCCLNTVLCFCFLDEGYFNNKTWKLQWYHETYTLYWKTDSSLLTKIQTCSLVKMFNNCFFFVKIQHIVWLYCLPTIENIIMFQKQNKECWNSLSLTVFIPNVVGMS